MMLRDEKGRFVKGVKGIIPWNRGLTKVTDARVRKYSETKRGRHHTTETKNKMREAKLKNPVRYWLGRHRSIEDRKKIGENQKGRESPRKGKHLTAETRKKISNGHKGKRLSDEHVKHIITGNHIRPTKPERKLIELIQRSNLPFKYVGDGKIVIHGKCPDFINNNGAKQIIELFGDYWHRSDNPQDRISVFKEYGFDTLIIWEHELENEDRVMDRLKDFAGLV